jgi:hypothetical protein
MKRIVSFVLLTLTFSLHQTHAETKVWTGLSTNLPPKWSDPDNWTPSPPGELDDVIIGEPPFSSQAHITVQGPIKVRSLHMNRTTLIGAAQFEVATLLSKGAALTDGGAMKITGSATILRGPSGEFGLTVDGWTINNEGNFTIGENATVEFFSHAGRLNNSGTVDMADNSWMNGLSGAGSEVVNSGTLRKAAGAGKATINALRFVNNGSVLVSAGRLSFPVGSVATTGTMAIQGAENTIIFEGASLALNGGALTGDGEFIARGSTVITVNADTPIDILNLACDVTGVADLTVQKHLVWSNGQMSGGGQTISVTQLTIEDPAGGGTRTIRGRTLRNKLKALWRSGDLTINEGGRFENEVTGEWTIGDLLDKRISGSFTDSGGIFNAGLIKLLRENARKTSIYCTLNNSNRVEYSTTLLLYGGGAHSGAFVHKADPTASGRLEFLSGTNHLDAGFTSTTFNPVYIANGTVNVRGLAKADQLELDSGTITGPGDLELSNHFLWSSGTIRGAGTLRMLPNSTFDWGTFGANRELIQRTVEIGGIGIWNVNFTASDGAVVRITEFGELRAGPAESMQWNSGALPMVDNRGRFIKETGLGTAYFSAGFANKGMVIVRQGKIQFFTGYIQEAGITEIDALAEIQANRGMTNDGRSFIYGLGRITGGTTNFGNIRPGKSPGILKMNDLLQRETGAIEIEITGRAAGTEYDQLIVEGAAVFDGELQVNVSGFTPLVGDRFEVISYQSRSGQFKVKTGAYLGNGLALLPEYSATKLTLVATAITPEEPALTLVQRLPNGHRVWSWPTILGKPYQVEYSADLIHWLVYSNLIATGSNLQLELPAPPTSEQARFYRIH